MNNIQRIFDLHDESPLTENGCKIWPLYFTGNGYPTIKIKTRSVVATRVILERRLGRPIGKGLYACHECDNPKCFCEDHLFEGTPKQNVEDCKVKGRLRKAKGSSHGGSLITEKQALEIWNFHKQNPNLSIAEMHRRMHYPYESIRNVITGRNWNYITGIVKL